MFPEIRASHIWAKMIPPHDSSVKKLSSIKRWRIPSSVARLTVLNDDLTLGQLADLLYELDSRGQIKIEPKDKARELCLFT